MKKKHAKHTFWASDEHLRRQSGNGERYNNIARLLMDGMGERPLIDETTGKMWWRDEAVQCALSVDNIETEEDDLEFLDSLCEDGLIP